MNIRIIYLGSEGGDYDDGGGGALLLQIRNTLVCNRLSCDVAES